MIFIHGEYCLSLDGYTIVEINAEYARQQQAKHDKSEVNRQFRFRTQVTAEINKKYFDHVADEEYEGYYSVPTKSVCSMNALFDLNLRHIILFLMKTFPLTGNAPLPCNIALYFFECSLK